MTVTVLLEARRIARLTAMGLRAQTTVDTALHLVEGVHHLHTLQILMLLQKDVAREALVSSLLNGSVSRHLMLDTL